MKGEGQRDTHVPSFPQAAGCWESPHPSWAPARVVGSAGQHLSPFPGIGAACRPHSYLSHQHYIVFPPSSGCLGGRSSPGASRGEPAPPTRCRSVDFSGVTLAESVAGRPGPACAFALAWFGFFLSGGCGGKEAFP